MGKLASIDSPATRPSGPDWVARLSRELFSFEVPATRGELLAFRAIELIVCAFTLDTIWPWAVAIQRHTAVILPLGLAQYIDITLLFGPQAYVAAALASVLIVLGFLRVRYAYAGALLVFHLLYAARYCLGEISHGSNFAGTAVLALAVGTALARDAQSIQKTTLGFLCFFFGIGYTSAGVCKLVATGPDWAAGEHLILWMRERGVDMLSSRGVFQDNSVRQYLLAHPGAGAFTLGFGLVAELAGVCLWFRRLRPFVAGALIAMHTGIGLTMGLYFPQNITLLACVGFPWGRWLDALLERAAPSAKLDGARP